MDEHPQQPSYQPLPPQFIHTEHYHESHLPGHSSRLPSPSDAQKRSEYWWKRYFAFPLHPIGWLTRIALWVGTPKLASYAYIALEQVAITLNVQWYFAGAVSLLMLFILGLYLLTRQHHPDIRSALDFHILLAVSSAIASLLTLY